MEEVMTWRPCSACCSADAADGEVVGLRAAGEEDDLVRARADERGDLAPRAVDGGARLLPVEVDARSVAELLGQVRQHRLDDARGQPASSRCGPDKLCA